MSYKEYVIVSRQNFISLRLYLMFTFRFQLCIPVVLEYDPMKHKLQTDAPAHILCTTLLQVYNDQLMIN
jgi:hypothetical protein